MQKSDVWIDQQQLSLIQDPLENMLIQNEKIAYHAGKGNNHIVTVLITSDTVIALTILTSDETQQMSSISPTKKFVFPYTANSEAHVLGSNSIKRILEHAGVKQPELMTATKMRHRVSILYCLLDLPRKERELFYCYMGLGHLKEINENVYQTHLGLMTSIKLAKHR